MSADVVLSRETPEGDRLEFGPPATLVPRSAPPVTVLERSTHVFGYVEQSARLAELVERGAPGTVGICGPGGVGKTELLARALAGGAWPDGRVLLSGRDTSSEDLIALLCDRVFDGRDPRRRPSSAVCSMALAERKLLVAIDDVRSAVDLAMLQDALGSSLLLITTSRPWNVAGVEWIGLQGLTSHGISVLRDAAGADVPGDLAVALVHGLHGNPSRIARAARLGLPLEKVLASCTSDRAFDELSLACARELLSSHEQLVLAAVATFGALALGGGKPPAALVRAGFLERSPVGWAVPSGLRERAAELERDAGVLASALLAALAGRERRPPAADNVLAATPGLLGVIECDGVPASQAGRVLSSLLDGHGLWAASSEVCEALRILARKLEDPAAWAWATQQLAARRACAGDAEGARTLFAGALAAWRFIGDERGCALTVANLALLSGESATYESDEPPSPQAPEAAAWAGPAPEPEVVLLPPEPKPVATWRPPVRQRKAATPPAAFAVTVGAVAVAVAFLLWLAMRQSDEQQLARAFATPTAQAAVEASPLATPAAVATMNARSPEASTPSAQPSRRAQPQTRAALAVKAGAAAPKRSGAAAPKRSGAAPPKHRGAVPPKLVGAVPPKQPESAEPKLAKAASALRGHRSSPQHVTLRDAGRTQIKLLSVLPATIGPHASATLCVSAVNAVELYVSDVGELKPNHTSCVRVSPVATTTYVAQAVNGTWRTTRTITLKVTAGGAR